MKQFSKELGKVSITPKGNWDSSITNERLDIVYDRRNNQAYIAKQDVPIGVDIDNREYWQPLNVSGYADNNFINLTAENENGTITAYESLEEAVATIFPINRRVGATLSFYNLNSDRLDRQAEFELWQFNSTDLSNWENKDYWNNIYYNWNVFVGWYIGADALKNHAETPNVGQYAYVGSNLNDAILYQCRTNGTWTNTGIKVRNYISVVVSGNITIGENGNWFSDGEDTGIPSTPTVDEQLDNIIMQLQQHTTEISNLKASDVNLQDQITSNDTDITNLTAKHESLSRTVQGIAVTGGASTATNVTYNNDASELNAENAQDAIDELQSSKFDKTSILQDSGKAEDKVMSQKAVSSKFSEISEKTYNILKENITDEDEEIIIGESEEDYIVKINKKGLSANAFFQKNSKGNYEQIDTHKLTDKKVVGIGDSLSQSGYYEKDFCDISGADYVGVYSVGGTFTPPNGGTSTQDRAKKLIESGKDVDIILLENINDGWFAYSSLGNNPQVRGSINDESFMLSQYVNVDTDKVSKEEAVQYFRTNFQNIVNPIENKQKGTVVRIKYNTKSYVLTVTNDASNSGELVVTTKSTPKTITITSGMSKEDIAKKIYEYAYDGYEKSINGNVVTLVAKASTSTIPVIDAGTTGVVVQIDTSESATYTNEYFYGYTAEEFVNDSNWKDDYISLYSLYKGVIEYLQTNKPNVEIVFVMPAVWNLNYNDQSKNADCRNSDGSYNIDKCYQTKEGTYYQQKAKLLRQIQTEVAELYSIKYIDLHKKCGITPFNISEYYNPGDVHPKRHTYTLWAKEIYKLF